MEAVTEQEGTPAPDAEQESILDQIESEASAMTPGPETAEAGAEAPAKEPFKQPTGAFETTHAMIVSGIKTVLSGYEGGEEAGEVWESPLFKGALIPVMVKYNISIHNLPPEMVLGGAILWLAKQSADILKTAAKKRSDENAQTPEAQPA